MKAGLVVVLAAVATWVGSVGTPPDAKYCHRHADQYASYQACVDWYDRAADDAGPPWR